MDKIENYKSMDKYIEKLVDNYSEESKFCKDKLKNDIKRMNAFNENTFMEEYEKNHKFELLKKNINKKKANNKESI